MPNNPGILRNLHIKRVALVDSGANFDKRTGDGAHIMLFKSSPAMSSTHVDSTDWETDYEKANLDAAARNALPDSAFAAVWTDAQGKKRRKLPIHDAGHLAAARGRIDGADIPADVKAAARRKIEAATNRSHKEKNVKKSIKQILKDALGLSAEPDATKRATAAAELVKAVDDLPDDHDADDVPVHKADDPMCKCEDCMAKRTQKSADVQAVEKALSDIQKVNADLQKRLNTEIEKRETVEIVTLLKSFKATPFDMDKDPAVYLALKRTDPAAFDRTIAIMKATDAQLAASALFHNVGSSRLGSAGSAWEQIEAKADALMEKSTKEITREQAIEKVMLDPKNNVLVKQYRAEQQ